MKEPLTKTCSPSWLSISWQTQCGNAQKYPMIVHQVLGSLRFRSLELCSHMQVPFYTSLIMTSWSTTHINVWSFGDVMLFWQETHVHVFRCVSSNSPLRACLLVWPCSNYLYGTRYIMIYIYIIYIFIYIIYNIYTRWYRLKNTFR